VNEVTRERAQSFLTDDHIQRIVAAYRSFRYEGGFAQVISNDEIREKGSNLSIPLYVRADKAMAMAMTYRRSKGSASNKPLQTGRKARWHCGNLWMASLRCLRMYG